MPIKSPYVFKRIFENSKSTCILVLDLAGNIQDINIGFQKSFGYSPESLIGRNFIILFTEEDIGKGLPEKELKEVLETGSANDNNYLVHEDGSHIWVNGESIYMKDESGWEYIVKIIHNLQETKILEQKLKEINHEQKK